MTTGHSSTISELQTLIAAAAVCEWQAATVALRPGTCDTNLEGKS